MVHPRQRISNEIGIDINLPVLDDGWIKSPLKLSVKCIALPLMPLGACARYGSVLSVSESAVLLDLDGNVNIVVGVVLSRLAQ